jgi:HK97 family phage portal protein
LEWQLDAVVWHQVHGWLDPEAVPAIYAATDLISATVGRLDTHTSTPLSRKPDPFDTRFNFFFDTTWSLCFHGDAYWLLTETERGVDSMQVLPAKDIGVAWDDAFGRRVRVYTFQGRTIPSGRIRHLRFHPRPGELEGLSPIEAARLTWEGAAGSESWGSSLFAASGVPSGVIEVPTALTTDEATELRDQWHNARAGVRSTAILSGGMKYVPVELSPADIEWLATRASNAQEVARIFHIPSDMLEVSIQGGSSSITYRNLAAIGADFVEWCLNAYLRVIEEAWVSLPGQPEIRFDTRPLYREDLATRTAALKTLTEAGLDVPSALTESGFDLEEMDIGIP